MNRKEFEQFFKGKGINLEAEGIIIGKKTNQPCVEGCYEEHGVWKVFSNSERQNTTIILEGTEEEAFGYLESIATGRLRTKYKL